MATKTWNKQDKKSLAIIAGLGATSLFLSFPILSTVVVVGTIGGTVWGAAKIVEAIMD